MTADAQRIAIAAGVKVGSLTAIEYVGLNRQRNAVWKWRCSCGAVIARRAADVQSGHTSSCGCYRREATRAAKTVHGNAKRSAHSSEYRSWRGIMTRCLNPNNPAYVDYGGRGICVCERWMEFSNFLADMGTKPSRLHSIDRIHNGGNYEPGNCRWATPLQQASNRRKRRWKKKP